MKKYSFKAVIFDLDGVVTQTALVHSRAWKLVFDQYLLLRQGRDQEVFREFTHEGDYLPFVDGLPRYAGVSRFLESRKIRLAFGNPDDEPGQETICGLGNKKDLLFRQLLREEGALVYPSTIEFIKTLKKSAVRVGVASSSKNCQAILQSAGIEQLFQSRVDGEVSSQLGLAGKPEGDIFITAAQRLGVAAAESVVVEDALAGVTAGRNGEFGLVLGVARKDNAAQLLDNGADMVVSDLSQITPREIEQWFCRRPRLLFSNRNVLKQPKKQKAQINPSYLRTAATVLANNKNPALFIDYDGTLTPIVQRPELAVLAQDMKDLLYRISEKYTLALISGRQRQELQELVGIRGIFYAGNHGLEIHGPGVRLVQPEAQQAVSLVKQAQQRLHRKLSAIPGILIENKKFSVSLHYRQTPLRYLSQIKQQTDRVLDAYPGLRKIAGNKVIELLPDIGWDKGQALRWLVQTLNISWKQNSVIFIGDDTTDEDAFRVLRTRGTAILVAAKPKVSAADFRLSSVNQVKKLLAKLIV